MAKKWPEKFVQRSFIKEHSFPNSLYHIIEGHCCSPTQCVPVIQILIQVQICSLQDLLQSDQNGPFFSHWPALPPRNAAASSKSFWTSAKVLFPFESRIMTQLSLARTRLLWNQCQCTIKWVKIFSKFYAASRDTNFCCVSHIFKCFFFTLKF